MSSPNRRKIRNRTRITVQAGPDRLPVLLSRKDRDLIPMTWWLHPEGYAYHRPAIRVNGKLTRPCLWLHRLVAQRMNGGVMPRRVFFRNGCRLDCTRSNLKIFP